MERRRHVDIAREMSHLTLEITARILFGAEGDAVAAEIGDALEAATSLLEVAVLPFAALIDLSSAASRAAIPRRASDARSRAIRPHRARRRDGA